MLLSPPRFSLEEHSERVLRELPEELAAHTSLETHAAVLEITTGVHSDVAGAVAELASLRAQLARELRGMGLVAASAGTYPLAHPGELRVSRSGRYGVIAESMRGLAHREPTLALHVHVGVPDPEDAIRLLNGLRDAVPILIALSANSPFSQGRDSGFDSMRTVIFQAFPRTGTARWFKNYADYVEAVDALIASGALPDPTYLWWDVRLQPALGTVELRMMDAQTTVADSAALIAFVMSLARAILDEGDGIGSDAGVMPEVLAENRFLAARDGLDARLIDPTKLRLVPARALLNILLARCRAHADAVGLVELDRAARLLTATGADRQRAWARVGGDVELISGLAHRFAPPGNTPHRVVRPSSRPAETLLDSPRLGSISTCY